MALNSVNTNYGAMIALQNLSTTQTALQQTQNEISTGLKVGSPKDNGAIWAIAQNQRAQSSSLDSVMDSLSRGTSAIDVAMAAGQSISDLLTQMKTKALAASDPTLDQTSRDALNSDFTSLRDQITTIVNNADFNGVNLIKSGGTNIMALANADGSSKITVQAQDLSLGGGNVTVGSTDTIGTATTASGMISTLQTSINQVSAALAKLGTGSSALSRQQTFVTTLQNTINNGVGNLVDANMASESAQLQALQTKQQLGIQALSIANSSTNSLLSLFR
jgi:flagellin